MEDNSKITALAILCVTVLEGIALATGQNGQMLSLAIGALCALAGAGVMRKYDQKKLGK